MKIALFILSFLSIVTKADMMSPQVADRTDVPEVAQGNYLVGALYQFPAIQTYGLATCIGVTLYDSTRRQGALMHVSATIHIPAAVDQIVNEMIANGSSKQNIQVQLFGGWDSSLDDAGMHYTSDQMVSELLREFDRQQISVIHNETLVTRAAVSKGAAAIINIELDLMTGAAYRYPQSVPYFGGDISRPMPQN